MKNEDKIMKNEDKIVKIEKSVILNQIILYHFVSFYSRRQGSQFFESCFSSSYMLVWQFLENLLGRIKMYKIHVYTQQLLFQFLLQARVV